MWLPLITWDMDRYLSYDNITQVCNSILVDKGELVHNVLIGTKILAVAFILLYWLIKYAESLKGNDADGKSGITVYNIVRGVVYIVLVCSFNNIVDMVDRGLGAYDASFGVKATYQMYEALDEDWIAEDEEQAIQNAESSGFWDSSMNVVNQIGHWIANLGDIWWWGLQVLKIVGWLINIMVMPIFLLERGFLLVLMKISFPLILALGANEAFQGLLKKWLGLYCAIFLTGLFFILATQFCDEAYRMIVNEGGMADDNQAKTIIFAVVVFAKVKLFKGAIELSYKLFNL